MLSSAQEAFRQPLCSSKTSIWHGQEQRRPSIISCCFLLASLQQNPKCIGFFTSLRKAADIKSLLLACKNGVASHLIGKLPTPWSCVEVYNIGDCKSVTSASSCMPARWTRQPSPLRKHLVNACSAIPCRRDRALRSDSPL